MQLKRHYKNGDEEIMPERRNVSMGAIISAAVLMTTFVVTGVYIGDVLAEVKKIDGKADRSEVRQQYANLEQKIDSNRELYDVKLDNIDQKTEYIYDILLQNYGAVQVKTE